MVVPADCCRAYIPEIKAVFVNSNRLNVIILIHVVLLGVSPLSFFRKGYTKPKGILNKRLGYTFL